MEYEKMVKGFTISSIIILLVTTLIATSFVIITKANGNLGVF